MPKRVIDEVSADESSEEEAPSNKLAHFTTTFANQNNGLSISCHLPPHAPISFASYHDYEQHYMKAHTHRCLGCDKNFPTQYLLDLHIAENHDPLREARLRSGEKTVSTTATVRYLSGTNRCTSQYACVVEGCDKICSTWGTRRLHAIDKHHFPRDFDFFIINDGIDKKHSLIQDQNISEISLEKPAQLPTKQPSSQSNEGGQKAVNHRQNRQMQHSNGSESFFGQDADERIRTGDNPEISKSVDGMDVLTTSMSSLRFVPNSVRQGKKGPGVPTLTT